MVIQQRPTVVKMLIDFAARHLQQGCRVRPTALLYNSSRNEYQQVKFNGPATGDAIRSWLTGKLLRSPYDEICLVYEAVRVAESPSVWTYALQGCPSHDTGQVFVTWENRSGESRIWMTNVAWPDRGTLLCDGFREMEAAPRGARGNVGEIYSHLSEVVLSN